MKSLLKLLLLCIVAISATSGAAAQGSDSIQEQPVWSLLTVAPGNEVYELDGHTGLRYRGTDGTDFVVNWGVFDFNSPNFLYRFVKVRPTISQPRHPPWHSSWSICSRGGR